MLSIEVGGEPSAQILLHKEAPVKGLGFRGLGQ